MSTKPTILVIDDDQSVLVSLALLLKQSGYEALTCEQPTHAMSLLKTQRIDLIIQDMNFSLQTSGEEGLQLLADIKALYPEIPVLLMTAWGSIALAVRGVKAGAADFFTKPWQNTQLQQLIATTLDLAQPREQRLTRLALDQHYQFSAIIGEHPDLLRVLATVGRVASAKAPVLILGESGTGKELIADAIHHNSPRATNALIKVNMGAITSSLFESEMFGHVKGAFTDAKTHRKGHFASANQGSLFLDEIGELHKSDQVKLLRVLQEQRCTPVGSSVSEVVDVRIISATNRELAGLVASGDFREDLFYRLNLITLRLPALRERRSDIALIATAVLRELCRDYQLQASLSVAALDWLSAQPWPGNIRQLRQSLERSLLLCSKAVLDVADFVHAEHVNEVSERTPIASDVPTLDQAERQLLERALTHYHGNISHVAKNLGLSRAAVYRRLAKHGLQAGSEE